MNSTEPLGTPIADHRGNPNSKLVFCQQGTAGVYSAGVGWHIELIFPKALPDVLEWIETVAIAGARYKHPWVVVTYSDPVHVETTDWSQEAPDSGGDDYAAEAGRNGVHVEVAGGEALKGYSNDRKAQNGDDDQSAEADRNGADIAVAGGKAPNDCRAQNGDDNHAAEADCNGTGIAVAGGEAPKDASNDCKAQNGGDHWVAVAGDGVNDEAATGSEAPQKASNDFAVSENKCGLNFFAEDGGESPPPRKQHAEGPTKQANSGWNEPINFFAELSEDEEDDMDEETRARLNKGIERFLATGSMMDPREEERIEAEIQDIKDGIAGMY